MLFVLTHTHTHRVTLPTGIEADAVPFPIWSGLAMTRSRRLAPNSLRSYTGPV